MAKVTDLNHGAATARIETWFQKVKGLRLIQH